MERDLQKQVARGALQGTFQEANEAKVEVCLPSPHHTPISESGPGLSNLVFEGQGGRVLSTVAGEGQHKSTGRSPLICGQTPPSAHRGFLWGLVGSECVGTFLQPIETSSLFLPRA